MALLPLDQALSLLLDQADQRRVSEIETVAAHAATGRKWGCGSDPCVVISATCCPALICKTVPAKNPDPAGHG